MKQMKSLFALSAIALAMTVTSCGGGAEKASAQDSTANETQLVKVMTLAPQTIMRTQNYSAILEANEEVHLVSNAPGKISKINVEVGSRVSAGQVLVEMDATNLSQAKIQLANLQTDYNRMKILLESGSVSQQAYDQVKAQYDVTKTTVANLEANTYIRAPFAGVISGKYFESGEMYSGTPVATIGKAAIVSLVQINPLKTRVNVPEAFYSKIQENQSIEIANEIYPDASVNGKILRIYPTIDPNTHTFQVEIQIPNANEKLKPGMYCHASINFGEVETIVVPYQAVLKLQGSNERYVFLNENGVAKRITVTLGQRFDDQTEIISDKIKKGDEIVIEGQARLIDGAKLRIEATKTSIATIDSTSVKPANS